ncbi:AAA family ATPase [Bradyrhizobium yuanmingense]|uniref:Adenylate kinase n=1 Tax=Bradyrhizobium yuanmingense TaxID=108015 RepID=A0A1C3XMC4_9BRAD|nr:AAA family ATPase [Bradyrhizobium yuanmingense]TWI16737.1 adenylate kinase [Bradyrhizobium yuanmingense]SCB53144.1 adenylate kinase [Bradyrhizobium yuanmingense]
MRQLCLVNGVPGVGKTSLCYRLLQDASAAYTHISFGQLILRVLRESAPDIDEKALRQSTTALVTQEVLDRATAILAQEVRAQAADDGWILLDSHAVSQDWFGYLASPDGMRYFEQLQYGAIVHLYASSEAVLRRSDTNASGRQARVPSDLETHSQLLNCVSILYSSLSKCPAYFVEASGSVAETATKVDKILRPRLQQ